MKFPHNKQLKDDQRGVASIIVVTIIILILTLVVLAMAQNANREQRQSLDRQLSNQAFYAAESGVNDTVEYIRKNLSSAPKEKTECDTSGDDRFDNFPTGNLDGQNLIRFSCVLYNQNPTTLQYNVGSGSTIIPIQNSESTGISRLNFEWQNSEEGDNFDGCPDATNRTMPKTWFANCDFGMLRIEVIDPNAINTGARNSLINSNSTLFIFPVRSGGSSINMGNSSGNRQGLVGYGTCSSASGTGRCSFSLTGVGLSTDSQLFLRVRSLYKPSTLLISGSDTSSQPVKFLNAQIMVDSTGKANDVLRRIQVRVPVRPQYDYPDFAIQTAEDLCKKIDIFPDQDESADSCEY